MKKFLSYLIFVITLMFVILYGCDHFIDMIYHSDHSPRSKQWWIHSFKENTKFDYALIGSSRCIHYIIPDSIDEKYNTSGINLAYAAVKPLEAKLLAESALAKFDIDKLFIQVDYSFNTIEPGFLSMVSWMPYYDVDYVYESISPYLKDSWWHKNMPMYTYMKYDTKTGFREMLLSLLGRSSPFVQHKGYDPIYKQCEDTTTYTYKLEDKMNIHIKSIIDLCDKEDVELYFFTSPIYNFNGDNQVLSNQLSTYTDFSNSLDEIELFSDHTHVNHRGAIKFTEIFGEYYFGDKSKVDSLVTHYPN